jgi:hypothetical protein
LAFCASKKSNIAAEHLVLRGRAEEELHAAALQAGRGGIGAEERHAVTLGDGADRGGNRRLVAADDGGDLLLGDQALGLGAALLRVGLVVGEDQPQLGATKRREPRALGADQVERVVVVDDVERGLKSVPGVDADLGAGTRHRIDHADDDLAGRLGLDRPGEAGGSRERHGGGSAEQQFSTIHDVTPLRDGWALRPLVSISRSPLFR